MRSSISSHLDCTKCTIVQLGLCSRVLDNHMSNCPVCIFFTLWIPPSLVRIDMDFNGQAGVRPFSGGEESGA